MYSILFSDPFTQKTEEKQFDGITLYDAVSKEYSLAANDYSISCVGKDDLTEVNPKLAKMVTPKSGKFIAYVKPKDSDTARIALTIALVAAGQYYIVGAGGLGLTGAAATFAGIGVAAGSAYLAQKIIPFSKTSNKSDSESSTLSISGSSNSISQGAVPYLIGEHKFYPPKAMQPITEAEGKDVFLTETFCLGFGPLSIDESSIKIGETQFSNFDGVEIQIKDNLNYSDPIDLVSGDVFSESVSANFIEAADEATRTTQADCEEITVELAWPSLVRYNDSGKKQSTSVVYDVLYSLTGEDDYTSFLGTDSNDQNLTFSASVTKLYLYPSNSVGSRDASLVSATESYVTFNDGLPASVTLGSTFTVRDSSKNNRTFTAYEIDGDTVKVGYYTIGSVEQTQESERGDKYRQDFEQVGTQVQNESGTDASVYNASGSQVSFTATDSTSTTTYRTHKINVQKGQYDVKIVRQTPAPSDTKTSNQFTWTQIKSTQYTDDEGNPIQVFPDDLCYIALKIKATDQLNGAISNLNVVAKSICSSFDSLTGQFNDDDKSGNPAWEYFKILTSSASKKPLFYEEIEISDFEEWSDLCDEQVLSASGNLEPRFRVNLYVDYDTTAEDLLQKIATIGRAARRRVDYKEGVLVDKPNKQPVINLSPANIISMTWSKSFARKADAYSVQYVNAEDDYTVSELLVKKDDSVAEQDLEFIEDIDGTGITDADQAYRFGKFAHAQLELRPEDYELRLGVNYLTFLRGDVISLTHDRIQGVTCFGQVIGVSGSVVTVDNPFNISNAELPLYATFSNPESDAQAVATYEITDISGNEITFSILPAFDLVDAYYSIGSSTDSITRQYVVTNIKTADDITATVNLTDYGSPTIFEAEDSVSNYVSGTVPLVINQSVPPSTPVIDSIISDERAILINSDGSLQTRANFVLDKDQIDKNRPEPDVVEVLWRRSDGNGYFQRAVYDYKYEVFANELQDDVEYDFKVRYISKFGIASEFNNVFGETVVGKTTPPPDISSINYSQGSVSWYYPNVPIDFAGFKVRYASGSLASWETATPLHDGFISQSKYDITPFVSSVNTFFVKAVDTSGNYSVNAAKVIVNLGDYDTSNIITTINKYTEEWPDEVVDGYIDSETGFLCSETSSFYQENESSLFYSLDGLSEFYSDKFKRMEYIFEYTPDPIDEGANLFVEFLSSVDGASMQWVEPDNSIFYDGSNNAFYGESGDRFYSDYEEVYSAFSGAILGMDLTTYKIKVIVPENQESDSCLEYVKILVDVEDIEEKVDDFVLLTGSGRIPLSKSFRSIRNMQITLQDQDASAFKAVIADKDQLLGPLIKVYDINNQLTQATVDVLVRGY